MERIRRCTPDTQRQAHFQLAVADFVRVHSAAANVLTQGAGAGTPANMKIHLDTSDITYKNLCNDRHTLTFAGELFYYAGLHPLRTSRATATLWTAFFGGLVQAADAEGIASASSGTPADRMTASLELLATRNPPPCVIQFEPPGPPRKLALRLRLTTTAADPGFPRALRDSFEVAIFQFPTLHEITRLPNGSAPAPAARAFAILSQLAAYLKIVEGAGATVGRACSTNTRNQAPPERATRAHDLIVDWYWPNLAKTWICLVLDWANTWISGLLSIPGHSAHHRLCSFTVQLF
jgi:hypothetical protein